MLLHFEGCFGKTRVLINGNWLAVMSMDIRHLPLISASFCKSAIMRYRSSFIPMMIQTDDGIREPECIVVSTSWRAPAFHIAHDGIFVYTDHITNGDAFARRKLLWSMIWQRQPEMRKASLKLTVSKKRYQRSSGYALSEDPSYSRKKTGGATGFCY